MVAFRKVRYPNPFEVLGFIDDIRSFITIISAFTEAGCKDPSKDPHASLGKEFQAELSGWCATKKAGTFFFWFATSMLMGQVH